MSASTVQLRFTVRVCGTTAVRDGRIAAAESVVESSKAPALPDCEGYPKNVGFSGQDSFILDNSEAGEISSAVAPSVSVQGRQLLTRSLSGRGRFGGLSQSGASG